MSESSAQKVYYECQNGCSKTWFFQSGTSISTRILTEDGEIMETEHYDFTASSPVKCYKCRAEAIIRVKTVRTITTVE